MVRRYPSLLPQNPSFFFPPSLDFTNLKLRPQIKFNLKVRSGNRWPVVDHCRSRREKRVLRFRIRVTLSALTADVVTVST
ncbi:hypothetical protein ACET3Z_031882 [Daucus carota]